MECDDEDDGGGTSGSDSDVCFAPSSSGGRLGRLLAEEDREDSDSDEVDVVEEAGGADDESAKDMTRRFAETKLDRCEREAFLELWSQGWTGESTSACPGAEVGRRRTCFAVAARRAWEVDDVDDLLHTENGGIKTQRWSSA